MATPQSIVDHNEFRHSGRVVTSVTYSTKPSKTKSRPTSLWTEGQPLKLRKKSHRTYSEKHYRPKENGWHGSNTCRTCNGYSVPIPCRDGCAICRCDDPHTSRQVHQRGSVRLRQHERGSPWMDDCYVPSRHIPIDNGIVPQARGNGTLPNKTSEEHEAPTAPETRRAGLFIVITGNACSAIAIIIAMVALSELHVHSRNLHLVLALICNMLLMLQKHIIATKHAQSCLSQSRLLFPHACLLCHYILPATLLVQPNSDNFLSVSVSAVFVLTGAIRFTMLNLHSDSFLHLKRTSNGGDSDKDDGEFGMSSYIIIPVCSLIQHLYTILDTNVTHGLVSIFFLVMSIGGLTHRLHTKELRGQEMTVGVFYNLGLTTSCMIIMMRPEPNYVMTGDVMAALDTFAGQSFIIHAILFYFCCAKHIKRKI